MAPHQTKMAAEAAESEGNPLGVGDVELQSSAVAAGRSEAERVLRQGPRAAGSGGADVSDADVATAVRVLLQFAPRGPLAARVMDERFKALRRAEAAYRSELEKHKYGGQSQREYVRRKLKQKHENAEHMRLKELDRERINAASMRKERIAKLSAMLEQPTLLLTGPAAPGGLLTHDGAAAEESAAQRPEVESKQQRRQPQQQQLSKRAAKRQRKKHNPTDPVISYSHLDSGRQDERVPKSFRDQGPAAAGPDASASEAEALRRALGEAKDEAERARLKEQLRRVANRDFVEAKQPTQADLRSDREKWRVRVYAEGEDSDPDVEFEEQRHQAHEAVREDLVKKDEAELHYPRSCYVCKRRFTRLHQFYDQLCPDCAALNWEKRNQVADLRGRVVLLTGCRVKIGFECGLKLLRCGATVIATTRFPHDCARRYAEQPDFAEWSSRLHIYGLDLRDLRGVVRFCDLLYDKYDRLDAIVNNAAQTVRRPRAYYRHLLPEEAKPADSLPQQLRPLLKGDPHVGPGGPDYTRFMRAYVASEAAPQIAHDGEGKEEAGAAAAAATAAAVATAGEGVGAAGEESRGDAMLRVVESAIAQAASGHTSALLSQVAVAPEDHHMHDHRLFPEGARDVTGQQLDLRRVNSWLLLLDQVDPSELVEVFAINCLAPFILNSRLKALMMRVPDADKYIINVSAMEGKFYRHKGPQHPHTNMAKAALNMMTRTSAQDYAKARIYMNSVDTGWINDENPFEEALRILKSNNFQTPIDEVDAMARVLDPLLVGVRTGVNPFGQFYKDYHVSEW